MTVQTDGAVFHGMLDYGVRNLNTHCRAINQLNVFPVPDGDTGTNMLTTVQRGLQAAEGSLPQLTDFASNFARSVVFEARGNSGVIVSQFLKGLSESLCAAGQITGDSFLQGLERGVSCAYGAVADPVEGTMLTVIKDSTRAVKENYLPGSSLEAVLLALLRHARISLENTPELLPVLKENGVVDSGGAGMVYLLEGMQMYLKGELPQGPQEDALPLQTATVDYNRFHRDSVFPYGYCTELLIQLLNGRETLQEDAFRAALSQLGESLVLSIEDDKVRLHIHTQTPEQIFALCHRYGEFLTVKVENMTVQNAQLENKLLCSPAKNDSVFAVVAVAFDRATQELFLDMGADVSICAPEGMSTRDYLEAFEKAEKPEILVFPNGSDALLCAMQAKQLYKDGRVTVINSRGIAECYASLPTIDFEQTDVEQTADAIAAVIRNLYVVSVARSEDAQRHNGREIGVHEYYSFGGKELLAVHPSLTVTVVNTMETVLSRGDREIVTIFYPKRVSPQQLEDILAAAEQRGIQAEIFTVAVDSLPCELSISFE